MEILQYFLNTFIAIFVIVDPFAVVPVYLMLTDRLGRVEREQTRRKAAVVSCSILVFFTLTGMSLFKIFGITMGAFQIAGGILLLSFGISQLSATRTRVTKAEQAEGMEKDDISIFPLATPLLAGPGSISTVVLYASKAVSWLHMSVLVLAIFLVILSTYYLLKLSPYLYKLLGNTGLNLLTRMMGLIVTAIGVQFIINGAKTSFGIAF